MELQLPGDFKFEIGAGKRMSHSIPLRQMQMPYAKRRETKEPYNRGRLHRPHLVLHLVLKIWNPTY